MVIIQSLDQNDVLVFIDDTNGHHQDCLGSARKDRPCVHRLILPLLHLATSAGWWQDGFCGLVRVRVVAFIGRSYDSLLSIYVWHCKCALIVFIFYHEVFLKSNIDLYRVGTSVRNRPFQDIRLFKDLVGHFEHQHSQLIL